MAELINIIMNNKNKEMVEFLNNLINCSETYQSFIRTKTEHAASIFEEDLLGKNDKTPSIYINIDDKSISYNDSKMAEKVKWDIVDDSLVKKMDWRYNKFGMQYGWCQKDAIISIKLVVSDAMEYYESLVFDELQGELATSIFDNTNCSNNLSVQNGIKATLAMMDIGLISIDIATKNRISGNQVHKLFYDQQIFLISRFYKLALAEFMEQNA
jgi:hypothetical protein